MLVIRVSLKTSTNLSILSAEALYNMALDNFIKVVSIRIKKERNKQTKNHAQARWAFKSQYSGDRVKSSLVYTVSSWPARVS